LLKNGSQPVFASAAKQSSLFFQQSLSFPRVENWSLDCFVALLLAKTAGANFFSDLLVLKVRDVASCARPSISPMNNH
jgi:hypothetical protein